MSSFRRLCLKSATSCNPYRIRLPACIPLNLSLIFGTVSELKVDGGPQFIDPLLVFSSPIYLTLPFARPHCLNTVWPGKVHRRCTIHITLFLYTSLTRFCILFYHVSCLRHSFLSSPFSFFTLIIYILLDFRTSEDPSFEAPLTQASIHNRKLLVSSLSFFSTTFFHILSSGFPLIRLGSKLFSSIYVCIEVA